jgi:hypothetical protein
VPARRCVVVEMIGTPASGKSTLVGAVLAGLQDAGYRPSRPMDAARPAMRKTSIGAVVGRVVPSPVRDKILWQLFLLHGRRQRFQFASANPRLADLVARSQRDRPAAADATTRRVSHWFWRMAGDRAVLLRASDAGEALVFDEGFLHRVVQLFASVVEEPNEAQIRGYIDLVPAPDLVVVVRAPVAVCLDRIRKRGLRPDLAALPVEDLDDFVRHAAHAVDLALAAAVGRGWPAVAVENHGVEPATAAARVRAAVASAVARDDTTGGAASSRVARAGATGRS